jgi:hypothetical protein
LRGAIGGRGFTAGRYVDLHGLSHQRAAERRDEQPGRLRVRLGMGGIADSQDVPGKFQHKVLEAPAGTDEWELVFSRELNAQ